MENIFDKPRTVKEYNIFNYIKSTFCLDSIKIYRVQANVPTLKVEDMNGCVLYFQQISDKDKITWSDKASD